MIGLAGHGGGFAEHDGLVDVGGGILSAGVLDEAEFGFVGVEFVLTFDIEREEGEVARGWWFRLRAVGRS